MFPIAKKNMNRLMKPSQKVMLQFYYSNYFGSYSCVVACSRLFASSESAAPRSSSFPEDAVSVIAPLL